MLALCRHWMAEVFQPMNDQASSIIIEHIGLLDSSKMEPLLLQLVAHVAMYKVILSRYHMLSIKVFRGFHSACVHLGHLVVRADTNSCVFLACANGTQKRNLADIWVF